MSLQTAPVKPDQDSFPHPRIGAFDNSYARLPQRFFASQLPSQVAAPRLVRFNHALAADLKLDTSATTAGDTAALFAGNIIPEGADPIACAYAGHQFGGFSPQLGDGRAILLGEVIDAHGRRHDIQLKGSGRTPFSRGGDGRAAIGPVLREYLVSEAMHALGIPTTRALAAVTTGEEVYRDRLLPGAVLTRVAASHIRIGTFQYFAARRDEDAIRILADTAIARHYQEAACDENRYLGLLNGVIGRQASLVARWMNIGFIHGVMNTDNMSIAGETIDYGPCAFMESYDPGTVFSAIDTGGRYAYVNQPRIAQWNLARFAETLLPLLDEDLDRAVSIAQEALSGFSERFQTHSLAGMRAKLGLTTHEEEDAELVGGLLDLMQRNAADFTLTFDRLTQSAADGIPVPALRALLGPEGGLDAWAALWRQRMAREGSRPEARADTMRRANPIFIPRNHLVERALKAAAEAADYAPFETLLEIVTRPFQDRPDREAFTLPAAPDERVLQTFCGT